MNERKRKEGRKEGKKMMMMKCIRSYSSFALWNSSISSSASKSGSAAKSVKQPDEREKNKVKTKKISQ
jgi:hypothetical protein